MMPSPVTKREGAIVDAALFLLKIMVIGLRRRRSRVHGVAHRGSIYWPIHLNARMCMSF